VCSLENGKQLTLIGRSLQYGELKGVNSLIAEGKAVVLQDLSRTISRSSKISALDLGGEQTRCESNELTNTNELWPYIRINGWEEDEGTSSQGAAGPGWQLTSKQRKMGR